MKRKQPNKLISKWKQVFSKENASATVTEQKGNFKGASLALIKKIPVTFRLTRLESPKDFELMSFVVRACGKTGDDFKSVLHVEQTRTGSRLVASDGHRMHVAEISKKIKSGNYKPHVIKDVITLGEPVEGIEYPTWSKAISETALKRGVINLEKSGISSDRRETEKLSVALNAITNQTGETVNLRYIGDLTKREWAVYCQKEKHKAIILRQKITRFGEPDKNCPVAVILPIAQAA